MTGQQFRRWRQERGLTQTACAQLLGVSVRTAIRWEDGTTPVPYTTELALAYLSADAPWHDYGQRPVRVGDLLLEQRGKTFRVLDTDPAVIENGLASVQEVKQQRGRWQAVGEQTYARTYHCFAVLPQQVANQSANRATWQRLYEMLAKDRVDQATKARHRQADQGLWDAGLRPSQTRSASCQPQEREAAMPCPECGGVGCLTCLAVVSMEPMQR